MKSKKMVPLLIVAGFLSAHAADHTVTVNAAAATHTLAGTFHGVNYVGFWDEEQGSAGSRRALSRAGVKLLRFPGGVPGNYYDWEKSTDWTTTNSDKMKNYADSVGAALMFQTNPTVNEVNDDKQKNDSSGAHTGAWAQMCLTKKINVPFWEIGNEPEGEAPAEWNLDDWDSTNLRWYFQAFNAQAKAIKKVLPSAVVMGPSAANVWYWWHQHELELFLKFCNSNTDAVSLHWYGDGSTYNDIVGFAQEWYDNWTYIRSVTSKPVYITEWNNHGADGNINSTVGNALINADVMGVFARTGVAGSAWFGCIHGATNGGSGAWGILYGPGENKPLDTPTPAYFVLPLWTTMGEQVLNVANSADSVKTLSAYAAKKNNGTVQVMLINKAGARTVDVKFSGMNPAGGTLKRYELKSADGTATDLDVVYNNGSNPLPANSDLPAPTGSSVPGDVITQSLAAYSVTLLDINPSSSVTSGRPTGPAVPEMSLITRRIRNGAGRNALEIVAGGPGLVSVYDLRGKELAHYHISASSTKCRLVCSSVTNGIYIVRLVGHRSTHTVRFTARND